MAIIAKPYRPEKPVIEQPEIVVTPEPQIEIEENEDNKEDE
jgi:hypothetical protein